MSYQTTSQKNASTRNTIQRSLILETVRSLTNHPTSAEVYQEVRRKHPRISRATVYRNLAILSDRGEILRVKIPNGADRYDFNVHPHNHAQCRKCGRVFDLPAFKGQEELAQAVSDNHFSAETCHVFYEGVCATCALQA